MEHHIDKQRLPEAYLPRYLSYIVKNKFKQTIDDYKYFPYKTIQPSENPFIFKRQMCNDLFEPITYAGKEGLKTDRFDDFMVRSETTAFIVIKEDIILYENYFNGYGPQSISRFFSVTKSFASVLIGVAIEEGFIKSIFEPVTNYIPELKARGFDRLTIKNLLSMDSGIDFDEGRFPWSIQMRQYFSPDIRKALLNLKITDEIGEFFHYNDWHTAMLGFILERATGKAVYQYLEEKIWKPMGTESEAYITVDSARNGFEKMESGLVGKAIDLAKFGRLFLKNGSLNGKQIISSKWVNESTSVEGTAASIGHFKYYHRHPWGRWFATGSGYYKYMWWGYKIEDSMDDYFAMGILGQILYISPRKNMIVVRLGKRWGYHGWWPTMIRELIERI